MRKNAFYERGNLSLKMKGKWADFEENPRILNYSLRQDTTRLVAVK